MPKVTLIKDGQKYVFEAKEGQSILEVALENGIDLEHACGGYGFCTTCMCHVKDHPENLEDVTEREIEMGISKEEGDARLGCQARVKGDVEVEAEY